mmetsp:Transcript_1475/g.3020  ORF Transcript_1475/g.3020 Transcript_1475/m.3020 type:complete len:271 (+) Transcript_1475:1265-2077(+)
MHSDSTKVALLVHVIPELAGHNLLHVVIDFLKFLFPFFVRCSDILIHVQDIFHTAAILLELFLRLQELLLNNIQAASCLLMGLFNNVGHSLKFLFQHRSSERFSYLLVCQPISFVLLSQGFLPFLGILPAPSNFECLWQVLGDIPLDILQLILPFLLLTFQSFFVLFDILNMLFETGYLIFQGRKRIDQSSVCLCQRLYLGFFCFNLLLDFSLFLLLISEPLIDIFDLCFGLQYISLGCGNVVSAFFSWVIRQSRLRLWNRLGIFQNLKV